MVRIKSEAAFLIGLFIFYVYQKTYSGGRGCVGVIPAKKRTEAAKGQLNFAPHRKDRREQTTEKIGKTA